MDSRKQAQEELLQTLRSLLSKEVTFFDGSRVVVGLIHRLGNVSEQDPDFNAFKLIYSETDHLPQRDQWSFWNPAALEKIKIEYDKTERWAESFAVQACENLLRRYAL